MRLANGLLSAMAFLVVSCASISALTFLGCTRAAEQRPSKPAEKSEPAAVAETEKTERPAAQPAGPVETVLKSIPDSPEGMPPAPKVSTFAPAEDLAIQADKYIKNLEKTIVDDDEFQYIQEKIAKEANTLIIITLALGLHDEPNKYKDRAGALMQAAALLAAVEDLEAAKKAVAAVREAADGKRKSNMELKWGRAASLPELMKQVPLVNTKLKRHVKGERFKSKAKLTAGYTAVIAAIAQGSMADTSEAKDAGQVKQWFEFSVAMRDSAGALNAAIHKGDEPAAAEAMKKLAQSCNDCHAVFHPEAEIE
ncbi:MAG: cytochrome c [Planctomycetes bacterium]|nr:cytochrome c [Planctomycetota bacterium]MBU4397941.1 cytochrome c [Planctomycetota bacterium]MCG2685165.1 cytochrome c [Planctomycetales bacterium]